MSSPASFAQRLKAEERLLHHSSSPLRATSMRMPLTERSLPSIVYNPAVNAGPRALQLHPPLEDDRLSHDRPSPSLSNKENTGDSSPHPVRVFHGLSFYLVQYDGIDSSDRQEVIVMGGGTFAPITVADIVLLPFKVGGVLPCAFQNVIDLVSPRPCLSYEWIFQSALKGARRPYARYKFPVHESARTAVEHRLPTPPPVSGDLLPSALADDAIPPSSLLPPQFPCSRAMSEELYDDVPSPAVSPSPETRPVSRPLTTPPTRPSFDQTFMKNNADHDSLFSEEASDDQDLKELDSRTSCAPVYQNLPLVEHSTTEALDESVSDDGAGTVRMVDDGTGEDDVHDDGGFTDINIGLQLPPSPAGSEWLPRDEPSSSLSPVPFGSHGDVGRDEDMFSENSGSSAASSPASEKKKNSVAQQRSRSAQSPPPSPPNAKRHKSRNITPPPKGNDRESLSSLVTPAVKSLVGDAVKGFSAAPQSPTKDAASVLLSMSTGRRASNHANSHSGRSMNETTSKRKHENVSQQSPSQDRGCDNPVSKARRMDPVVKVIKMVEEREAAAKAASYRSHGGTNNPTAQGATILHSARAERPSRTSEDPKAICTPAPEATLSSTEVLQLTVPQSDASTDKKRRRSWDEHRPKFTLPSFDATSGAQSVGAREGSSRIPGNQPIHWSQGASHSATLGSSAVSTSGTRQSVPKVVAVAPNLPARPKVQHAVKIKPLPWRQDPPAHPKNKRRRQSRDSRAPGPPSTAEYQCKTFRNQYVANRIAEERAQALPPPLKRRSSYDDYVQEEVMAQRQSLPYSSSYIAERDPRRKIARSSTDNAESRAVHNDSTAAGNGGSQNGNDDNRKRMRPDA